MKKLLTLLCAVGYVSLYATVHTVSNNPSMQPAQFTTIQAAIDAATAGDTIYIYGSTTNYAGANVNKPLTFIGPGYNPPSYTHPATVGGFLYLSAGSSNTVIIGLRWPYSLDPRVNAPGLSNIRIQRCHLGNGAIYSGSHSVNGLIIEHSIIGSEASSYTTIQNSSNVIIRNNVIFGYITASNQSSVIITNNVFIGSGSAFLNISNALICNNIFYGRSPASGTNVNYNSFTNNISYQTSNNVLPFGTNVGSGNLDNINPEFVDVPNSGLNLNHDYHLTPSSSGKNYGTDGTDVGVYGGSHPLPNQTGMARIPVVTSFIITNSSIAEGGSLNIQVEATKID